MPSRRRHLATLLEEWHFAEPDPKMAFVVGPRQCGKTTLARMLLEEREGRGVYRNWDDREWRRELARSPYGFLDRFAPLASSKPLAVLDEVHKFPRWKRYLKGLWDTRRERAHVLVTGSGRLDVYRRGGDSLLGRYHQYRLHPLSISELTRGPFDPEKDSPQNLARALLAAPRPPAPAERAAFGLLMRFGGFPEPCLAASERRHRLWLRERRERLLRDDIRDMTHIQLLSSVEEMVELLIPRAGSLLSLNNLREELGVAIQSVRLWMDHLERLFYVFRVRPYAGRIARALRKEPKLFLWDWSEIEEPGRRLENLVACALLRWCHFSQDWGQEPLDLRFVRDKEKREADFLLTLSGKPFLLIEVKASDTTPPAGFAHFARRLGDVERLLLVGDLDRPGRSHGTLVLPAAAFLSSIP